MYEENSEILPGLWQGGSEYSIDEEIMGNRVVIKKPFASVVTLNEDAPKMGLYVKELRFEFPDGPLNDYLLEQLGGVVNWANREWKSGSRTLIRCQMGLNRSSLVTGLVLINNGYSGTQAVDWIRAKRGPSTLQNAAYLNYLLNTVAKN